MSGVDIAGLVSEWREAMEGVSAGPWRHYRNKLRPQFGGIINEVQCRSKTPVVAWPGFEDSKRKEPKHALNAAWIARCSPSGISALLDALSEATRQRDEALAPLKASEEREAKLIRKLASARLRPEPCDVCGGLLTWSHDHRSDNTGLDDGPPLNPPRKKPAPKPADEIRDIRARAWATRRQKYGQHGHR